MSIRCDPSNYGSPEIVERVLRDEYPLHTAIYMNDEAAISQIFEICSLNPEQAETAYKVNSLFDASYLNRKYENFIINQNQSKFVRDLASYCVDTTPFQLSVRESKFNIANILINSGIVDLNMPFKAGQVALDIHTRETCDVSGLTPLQASILIENHTISANLVRSPLVEVLNKEENAQGRSAGHFAAIRGNLFILEKLHERDENSLKLRNYMDNCPFYVALEMNKIETAIFILKLPNYKMPAPEAAKEILCPPVQMAIDNDNVEFLKALLENNSEINTINEFDYRKGKLLQKSLIEYATANGKVNCQAFLRER